MQRATLSRILSHFTSSLTSSTSRNRFAVNDNITIIVISTARAIIMQFSAMTHLHEYLIVVWPDPTLAILTLQTTKLRCIRRRWWWWWMWWWRCLQTCWCCYYNDIILSRISCWKLQTWHLGNGELASRSNVTTNPQTQTQSYKKQNGLDYPVNLARWQSLYKKHRKNYECCPVSQLIVR